MEQTYSYKCTTSGFDLISQYFRDNLNRHQVEQFNYFVKQEIRDIIFKESPLTSACGNIKIVFSDVTVERPYFIQKTIRKNKNVETKSTLGSCVEISPDSDITNRGDLGSYETIPLYPNEARKRNINYDGSIIVTAEVINRGTVMAHPIKISIGKLPIMLNSDLCWKQHPDSTTSLEARKEECSNDEGGYFIIKGKERVLISQLRKAYNRVYVEKEENVYIAEMRSMNSFGNSVLIQAKYLSLTNEFFFSLPYIKTKSFLPAGLVFKALGASLDEMIQASNCTDNELVCETLVAQFQSVLDKQEALNLIAKDMSIYKEKEKKTEVKKTTIAPRFENADNENTENRQPTSSREAASPAGGTGLAGDPEEGSAEGAAREAGTRSKSKKDSSNMMSLEYLENVLQQELFYHVGELTPEKSTIQLGFIIRKILNTVNGNRSLDDKDNIANKNVDATCSLLSFLFQIIYKQFTKNIVNQIDSKKCPDVFAILKDVKNITSVLNQAFMTGNWNTQKSLTFTRIGVSQVLNRQNYGAHLSHLRRIMLPIGGKGKNFNIRQIHPSQFNFICPYETPEGETVGIVLNLAMSAHITTSTNVTDVKQNVNKMRCFLSNTCGKFIVILNGQIIGSCDDSVQFKKEFDVLRFSTFPYVGLIRIFKEREIHIETNDGRFIRPLFALGPRNTILYKDLAKKLNKPLTELTWKEAFSAGAIVFRDVWELEQSVVAMTEADLSNYRCDYLEIDPASTMMAVSASVIPLSNHSQSPRNAYQASMSKQAIGLPSLAFQNRFDTTLHVSNTFQKPITRNNMIDVLHFNEMSHGMVAIVAIMTFSGFNQEDSIVMNKGSIDRGLFHTTTYKTIVEEEKKKGKADSECICLPCYTCRNRNYDYSHLNEQGLVWKKNTWLSKNTVVIGKVVKKILKNESCVRETETVDASVVIKHGEEGYLDKVLVTTNGDGVRIVKIRVRVPRIPEIGDKFASSTAQKGTCGMIFSEEDIPFDKDGVRPDLIINPHAIPSRMTINMLIEMFFNKVGCQINRQMDATPFQHRNIEQELKYWSEKTKVSLVPVTMYSGITGQQINNVFMGPCYYQRLKHLVSDKKHARMSGPLDAITHQPVAGRSKNGALRFGEMEKDALITHGSSRMLKETLFDNSDPFQIPICTQCGFVSDDRVSCKHCNSSSVQLKNLPYATKLLLQELAGMGIKTIIK
jgi:DNA-directed RNA polymerase II subunit RPB2